MGDSVKSMGVEVALGADKGVDCVGCARIGSVAVDGEQGVAGTPPRYEPVLCAPFVGV